MHSKGNGRDKRLGMRLDPRDRQTTGETPLVTRANAPRASMPERTVPACVP